MKVITLLNEKGGVGKTTLSTHIAAGLANKGQRVLLIDADAQGHSSEIMGIKDFGGLYRLLIQEAEWNTVIREPKRDIWSNGHPQGFLWLLPSNIETRAIPMLTDDTRLMRDRLEEIASYLDVVVIDTSPTPSMLHSMIYIATDFMVYPSQCEKLSLTGLNASRKHIAKLNENRKLFSLSPAALLGVAPTMYADTNAHRYGLDLIEQEFGAKGTLPAINRYTIWQDAAYAEMLMFAYAPQHHATQQMIELVEKVQERIA